MNMKCILSFAESTCVHLLSALIWSLMESLDPTDSFLPENSYQVNLNA